MRYGNIAAPLICVGFSLISVSAWATAITVNNPSFEGPVATGSNDSYNGGSGTWGCLGSGSDSTVSCTAGGGLAAVYDTTAITSWTIGGADTSSGPGGEGDAGVVRGLSALDFNPATDGVGSIIPLGSQVAWMNSTGNGQFNGSGPTGPTSITQTLAGTLIGNGTLYGLTVYAGHDALYSDWPSGGVTMDLLGNGNVIAALSITDPGLGKWVLETLNYTGTISTAGETLGIEFTATDTQDPAFFDNVKLCTNGSCATGVPEPSSVAILGAALFGLGILGFLRRRRGWI